MKADSNNQHMQTCQISTNTMNKFPLTNIICFANVYTERRKVIMKKYQTKKEAHTIEKSYVKPQIKVEKFVASFYAEYQ